MPLRIIARADEKNIQYFSYCTSMLLHFIVHCEVFYGKPIWISIKGAMNFPIQKITQVRHYTQAPETTYRYNVISMCR